MSKDTKISIDDSDDVVVEMEGDPSRVWDSTNPIRYNLGKCTVGNGVLKVIVNGEVVLEVEEED